MSDCFDVPQLLQVLAVGRPGCVCAGRLQGKSRARMVATEGRCADFQFRPPAPLQVHRGRSPSEQHREPQVHASARRQRYEQIDSWGKAVTILLQGGSSTNELQSTEVGTIQPTCEAIARRLLSHVLQQHKPHTSGLPTEVMAACFGCA